MMHALSRLLMIVVSVLMVGCVVAGAAAQDQTGVAKAQAEIDRLMDQMKALVDQARKLQAEYQAAGPARKGEIEKEFNQLVARLEAMEQAITKAAQAREEQIRAQEAKADDLPRVLLKTTKGDVTIELFENQAPNTVANFISLVEKGYYDGLGFHRVLEGFMAQGGCPTGDGSGGPGYNIPCECYRPDARWHFRGTLSMAHAGRDTGGSQFFICFRPTPHLNGRHTAFGCVTDGIEVVDKLQRRDPSKPNPPQPDKILQAKVLRKRDHPYVPKKVGP